MLLIFFFIALGSGMYYVEEFLYTKINTEKEEEIWAADSEKKYKKYENLVQPKIHAIKVNMDIFPNQNNFIANGEYIIVNRSEKPIDTLLVNYSYNEITDFSFDRKTKLITKDTIIRFDVHELENPLAPGDSMKMNFKVWNEPNTLFWKNSKVLDNGTYISGRIFPNFGYRKIELENDKKRAAFGLGKYKGHRCHPEEKHALNKNASGVDFDWLDFEATVSTSLEQSAFAPGHLLKEWKENNRHYFHYKTNAKIDNSYSFHSGKYEVRKMQWEDVELSVYFHKGHDKNIQSLLDGLKESLEYCSTYFSPYPYKELRVIEYPITEGTYATAMANNMPYSESYFIADSEDSKSDLIDFPFYVSAHEMAHHWWGNMVIPADVLGSKMVTESMAEYVALQVAKRKYGKNKLHKFLKMDLELYLKGRTKERGIERALIYGDIKQDYINYRKGALVLFALSEYIGEENLNRALTKYEKNTRFQSEPYTTSLEMLDYIKKEIPDTLNYLIKDMFETITIHQNEIKSTNLIPLENGKYQVDIVFNMSKFRNTGKGKKIFSDNGRDSISYEKIHSLPLNDYIEIGIFEEEIINGKIGLKELYLQKHKVDSIQNSISIVVDKKPNVAGIDPYNLLIDMNPEDNRIRIDN